MPITILRLAAWIVNGLKPRGDRRYPERGGNKGRQRRRVNCAPGFPCPPETEGDEKAEVVAAGADRPAQRWAGYNRPWDPGGLGVAAQVSLYPLRQPGISSQIESQIERAIAVFTQHGLKVTPGSMSTVVSGDHDRMFDALKQGIPGDGSARGDSDVFRVSNACLIQGG